MFGPFLPSFSAFAVALIRTVSFLLLASCSATLVAAQESSLETRRVEARAGFSAQSIELEQRLQRLNWEQFKRVVEAVPKLKASVDAYGPLGWEYVRANYATYRWRKNIERLNSSERHRLAELIDRVRAKP